MFKLRVCYADSPGSSGGGTGTGNKGKSPKRATRLGGGKSSGKNATRVGIKRTNNRATRVGK